ncbi:MAG: PAS domain-containing protein [Tolypothrix carrinoi HA7290-LM1]|jgi:PAS domain S-box-containing protein|nr:PAS domain-containing protein [Tolypothrix carrinoi HA7290-LM1]
MFDSKVNICCFCATTYEGIIHNDDEIIFNANHAFVTMTGYQVKDLIGKNSFEIIPESQELIIKNILSNYEKPDEVVVVKKNGSTLTVQLQGKVIPRSKKCECWQ